ncbi:MAG: hypothetical protein IJX77_04490 [Ruminococcus sp.]|nr:hypothetical protein [Ruminococcus sp.]
MKKKSGSAAISVFVLSLTLIFLTATIFREKGVKSFQENRALAEMPELSFQSLADGSYFKELGMYFTDHFAGRSYWISAKGAIEADIGESIVNEVYISDDMLLDTEKNEIESEEEIAEIFNEFSEAYDGTVYIAAIPSSSGVYSDKLPEYLQTYTEKEQIDSLYSYLDSDIRKIDAYNILKMLNDNYIYYRSDSRWTSYGAYCVYRTVIQKLGFIPTAYDKYTIEHVSGEFRGNLYNKSQYSKNKADMLDIYTYADGAQVVSCTGYNNDGSSFEKSLYDRSYIDSNDMYRLYLGEDAPLIKLKTSVNNDRKLLVIKDDYANCFIPFLIQHYSEIAIVSPEQLDEGLSTLIDRNDYEQTLLLFGKNGFPEAEKLNAINK